MTMNARFGMHHVLSEPVARGYASIIGGRADETAVKQIAYLAQHTRDPLFQEDASVEWLADRFTVRTLPDRRALVITETDDEGEARNAQPSHLAGFHAFRQAMDKLLAPIYGNGHSSQSWQKHQIISAAYMAALESNEQTRQRLHHVG